MENDPEAPEDGGHRTDPAGYAADQPGYAADPDAEAPGAADDPAGDAADSWSEIGADDGGVPPGTSTALPPKLEAWRRRSAAGAILTGFALGLQEALETRKEEPSIVMETSGEPPKDLPVEADFEYGRPRQSVVQIRPWLLNEGAADADDEPGER